MGKTNKIYDLERTLRKTRGAVVILVIVIIVLLICLGFLSNNITALVEDIDEGYKDCAKYCDSKDRPLLLFDINTKACQCYNQNEEPAEFKNFDTGYTVE